MQGLSKILSSINDAVWSFDLGEQKFAYTNDRIQELFGVSVDTIQKKDPFFFIDFVYPDDYDFVKIEAESAFLGKNVELEHRLLVGGKVKWVQNKISVLFDDAGQPVLVTGIVSDITRKKQDEITFSETEKTFRYLFINNPNPLWIYDRATLKFLAINHAAVVKYGYSEREFLSMTIADIRPEEDVQSLLDSVNAVGDSYYNSGKYWRHIKKNGEMIYVDISGHGLKYRGREAEIVMAHDITKEVESRKKIALARRNLNALINNINDEIWSIDSTYKIISSNDAFKEVVKTIIGREIVHGESIFFPELPPNLILEWKQCYERALKGESFSFVSVSDFGPGKKYYLETKMSPIRNREEVIGVSCISSNISARIEGERKMVEQNKLLLELLSIASHELRGPVASLLGLTNVFNTRNYADPFNAEIIKHVQELTSQLDEVIHTLVDKTYLLQQENKVKYAVPRNQ
ncbi:PAS domain S-box protein [Pedobacter sp. SYSU D00535]|uniref:PAS domain S-box protein n=1 Tax=Pedobacter sp. SYSU D00535 TaxID=2810308 RepID=UPI001A97A4AF|nr:PAS domain S-box protein [Pedobacter sp. SYSU D00535]